jgi:general L-amino acid transport system permease protein
MQKDPQTSASPDSSPGKASFFWYDPKIRGILYQFGVLASVALVAWYLMSNTLANLEQQSIATGLGFLEKEAAFEIGESLIPTRRPTPMPGRFMVGALNTLMVAVIGIVLTR